MLKKIANNRHGFTFYEVLVAVGIVAIVGGSALTLFITSQTLFPMITARQDLLNETGQALNIICQLLMEANLDTITISTLTSDNPDLDGTSFIQFQVPFVQNGQVQMDANGEILWGSANQLNGCYYIGLTDATTLYANAAQDQQTRWARLKELLLPDACAVVFRKYTIGPADSVEDPDPCLPAPPLPPPMIKLIAGEFADTGRNNFVGGWLLGEHAASITANRDSDKIQITIYAVKSGLHGVVEITKTRTVTPHNSRQ